LFGSEFAALSDAERAALLSPSLEGLALPGPFVASAAQVSDAAHIVLKHVLNRMHHFPMALPSAAALGAEEDEDDEEGVLAAPGALVVSNISEDNDPVLAGPEWQLVRVELRVRRSADVLVRIQPHRVAGATDVAAADSSTATEDTTSSTILGATRMHFVFDDSVLLTAVERPLLPTGPGMPLGTPTSLRLIVRDLTGKYVWDLSMLDAASAEAFHARATQVRAFLGQQAVARSALTELHLSPELLLEAAARAQEHRFRALEQAWLSKLPVTWTAPRVSDSSCPLPTVTRHRGARLELPVPSRQNGQPNSPLPQLEDSSDDDSDNISAGTTPQTVAAAQMDSEVAERDTRIVSTVEQEKAASLAPASPADRSASLDARGGAGSHTTSPSDVFAAATAAPVSFSVLSDADPLEQVLSFVETAFPTEALLASETNQLEQTRADQQLRIAQAEADKKAAAQAEAQRKAALLAALTTSNPAAPPLPSKLRTSKPSVSSTPSSASAAAAAASASAAAAAESGFIPSSATSPRAELRGALLIDELDGGEGASSVRLCDMSSLMIDESAFGPVLPVPLPGDHFTASSGRLASASTSVSHGADRRTRKLRTSGTLSFDSIAEGEEDNNKATADFVGAHARDSVAALFAPPTRQAVSPFDYARALISRIYVGLDHLPSVAQSAPVSSGSSLLSGRDAPGSQLRSPSLVVLEDSTKLRRSLKLLDSNPARECHKIGIIYCGPAQDTQKALLANDGGSALYEAFLDTLGSVVSTASHAGFLGGLDVRSTGHRSLYWSSSSMEIMWHVVTLMPSRAQEVDEQQIHIKRQVGNDHVHVVWSEYGREYRPSIISSQFNDAHIVVYPMRTPTTSAAAGGKECTAVGPLPTDLSSGLYRISVFTKPSVPPFGPLQDNMVVRGDVLGALVRLTALNANRAIRYATAGYGRPFPTRRKYIDDILAKHVPATPVNGNNASGTTDKSAAALSAVIMPLLAQPQKA
jgi:hypothetical protein